MSSSFWLEVGRLCNFSSKEIAMKDEELERKMHEYQAVISNYEAGNKSTLRPYEAVVLKNGLC